MIVTIRTSPTVLIALSILAFGAPAATAADPVKQALKAFDEETKAGLDLLEATAPLILKQLDSVLDIIDMEVKQGGGFGLADASLVFNALKTFQSSLGDAMDVAMDDQKQAFIAADAILTGAGIGVTQLPKGLYYGDGGRCDDYRTAVLAVVGKTLAKADKRVRKSGEVFRKHAEIAFHVHLEAPRALRDWPGPGTSTVAGSVHTISIAMSASRLDATQENRVYLYGSCHSSDDLVLKYTSSFAIGDSTTSVTKNGPTWERTLFDVVPGHYVYKLINAGVVGGGARAVISVR